jgi:hypothetical protein
LIEKIESNLQGWKEKVLSMRGKVVLLNFSITSTPIYWMYFYKLLVQLKNRIDQLRKYFFWFGNSLVRKKIALIS